MKSFRALMCLLWTQPKPSSEIRDAMEKDKQERPLSALLKEFERLGDAKSVD